MHGLGRHFRTALVSAAALVLAGIGRAQFAPRFVKLDGVPAKAGAARANWTQLPNGAWTVRCYSGVLRQDGLRWMVVPPPVAGRLNFARLLLAGPAAEVLPWFTADLRAGLARARQETAHDRAAAGARLHALRSLALLVDATALAGLLAELEVLVPSAVALTREQLLFARADEEVAHVVAEAEVLAASTSKTPGTRPGVGEKENEKD